MFYRTVVKNSDFWHTLLPLRLFIPLKHCALHHHLACFQPSPRLLASRLDHLDMLCGLLHYSAALMCYPRNHDGIDVGSSDFKGKSAVNRQRRVYKAIWEELQTTVHAIDHIVFPCFFSK
ncbi:hypothetical protein UlMin_038939 [Ulmus minor]